MEDFSQICDEHELDTTRPLIVRLASVGDIDSGQDPARPLFGVPTYSVAVLSLREASRLVVFYIRDYQLGSRQWAGGEVSDESGNHVARVSYNGRVWKSAQKREALLSL